MTEIGNPNTEVRCQRSEVGRESGGGVYLYGFTFTERIPGTDRKGLDGKTTFRVLSAEGVAATYSSVDLVDFQEQMALQTPDWLIPRALNHEKVVEAIMLRGPVLPVRFGAVFSTKGMLEDYLVRHAVEIRRFLEQMADKEEWAVKAFLDLGRAEEWLLAEDAGVAARHRNLAGTPGTRYFQEKKLRGDIRRQAMAWGNDLASKIQAELQAQAHDSCCLKVQNQKGDAEQILNAAFLVERDSLANFRNEVARLTEDHAARGVSLELSGPWPPYHFCPTLEAHTVPSP